MTHVVAHVSDSYAFGGTEQAILQLLGSLDRQRWRCVLLHADNVESDLVAGARTLDVEHLMSTPPSELRHVGALGRLVRQIRALRPAVVHVHLTSPLACRFTILAAAIARVPAIIGTAQLFEEVQSGRGMLQHRLLASVVDRYIAVSEEVASKLRMPLRVPERKIRIVHNGVSLERFHDVDGGRVRRELTDGSDRPVILMVARLEPQKGHRFLLNAALEVPNALFVFAGDGAERAALEQQAAEYGLNDRVRFLRHRIDVPELLASCDVVALSSLHEGLPLSVLEGMASSKPVVATSIGGTDELVAHGETGLLVPPRDSGALAAAIKTILASPGLARRFGENGRARVISRFSVDAMARKVEEVYDDLLN